MYGLPRQLFFSNGTCIACYTKLGGTCLFCSDGEQNGQKCTECNKENCAWCANNKSAPNCERCLGSNYLENGDCKACNKKYGSNCVVCNSNNCLSCAQGYHLSADKKSCVANNGAWNCSEENFMQIGDICVTRKNMGDASILKINSSDVTIVKYGETCYSASASCCWQPDGVLSKASCRSFSSGGSYDACERTVCDADAAYKICNEFNYMGVKWRLPTLEEVINLFAISTYNLGDNGLRLGNGTNEGHDHYSQSCNGCYGSGEHEERCYRYAIYYLYNNKNICSGSFVYNKVWSTACNRPLSKSLGGAEMVRCVTEMSNFK